MTTIAHCVGTVAERSGGLVICVRKLALTLNQSGDRYPSIVFSARPSPSGWDGVPLELSRLFGPSRCAFMPGMGSALRRAKPGLIHVHGLWTAHAWLAFRYARAHEIPLVVSPHGMLDPWALRHGRLQKALAQGLFQRAMLRSAKVVVATAAAEAHHCRNAGITAPVAVVPLGVEAPPLPHPRRAESNSPHVALFLSRIHPKKGLLELVQAWGRVSAPGWRLIICGPDENGHRAEVCAAIARSGAADTITVEDSKWGAAKAEAFARADLFVLPSFSENFGLVIAEALAAGLPVITTRATPWQELETERCGWWIEPGVEPLVGALRDALARPPDVLRAMGARGAALIRRRYSWETASEAMGRVYDWALTGTGKLPGVASHSAPFRTDLTQT